jgi:hypothetical protein
MKLREWEKRKTETAEEPAQAGNANRVGGNKSIG